MANKNRPARMVKKPKKDAKPKEISREETLPMNVELIRRKRKESEPVEG